MIPGSPGGGTGGAAPPPYLLGGSLAGGGSPTGGGDAPLELRASLDCWACSVLVTAQNLVVAVINAGLAGVVFGAILTPALVMVVFGFLCHSTVRLSCVCVCVCVCLVSVCVCLGKCVCVSANVTQLRRNAHL